MHYDFVIIGSGFGGSVSALRLSEKGYRVLVLEKGKRWATTDFPKTNWKLWRWLYNPRLGLNGFFQMSFMRHVTVLHGVGVGGGSLVYANTLPYPKSAFFRHGSWVQGSYATMEWEAELAAHYATARTMLGAAQYTQATLGDAPLLAITRKQDAGRVDPVDVAVYQGPAGVEAPDPYFDGRGPVRVGCTHCGACMTGCRVGAKNTLDKNYLYLAERNGVEVRAETEVLDVQPTAAASAGPGRYVVAVRGRGGSATVRADHVIFAGGVMGTLPLLLALKQSSLPGLSKRVGAEVRTNSEALFGVVQDENPAPPAGYTHGVAITSAWHPTGATSIEPVRYGQGSGFFQFMVLPHVRGASVWTRLLHVTQTFLQQPLRWLRALYAPGFAERTLILLYMKSMPTALQLRRSNSWLAGWFSNGLDTELHPGEPAPTPFMAEATARAQAVAEHTKGLLVSLSTEILMGTSSTAHILGGATIGATSAEGVIDAQHRVHGYEGLYVIDGSAISANPGVNPSLTITAMAERAMTFIPNKVQPTRSKSSE